MHILKTISPHLSNLIIIFLILIVLTCGRAASTVSYRSGGVQGQALLCRPKGKGPFPAVVYNHGRIVDRQGYQGASARGYDLDGICQALAEDGFLAFAPIRQSGPRNIPRHKQEVSRAVDYVMNRPDVDGSRVALMGFSRGGLLTLMVGIERRDLKALLILAPAPGRGHFAEAVRRVPSLNTPVLLMVEAGDDPWILENFHTLKRALQEHEKEARTIRYKGGGGHRLFWQVDYYWKDVRAFLHGKLGGTPSR
ncbi:MAG: dienelactone hydrolase family protein [Candidatus Binatia bacterium]